MTNDGKEFSECCAGIPFLFELYFPVRVGEKEDLPHRGSMLVRFQHVLSIEVPQAAAAPVEGVVPLQVGQKALKVINPVLLLVRVEQVNRSLIPLLRRIERVTPLPLFIEERVYIYTLLHLVLNCRNIGDLARIVHLIKSMDRKMCLSFPGM